jgi:hypothetical protein
MEFFNWVLNRRANIKDQQDIAEKIYKDNPDLAMRIAMGEEKAPNDVLSAAVYAKVCDEAEKALYSEVNAGPEKIRKLEICRQLGNSSRNREISAESQKLKFRDPDSAIEKIKEVVNARRKAFEKTLPAGETYESHKKKMVEELRMHLMFLENYIEDLFNTQKEIETKIEEIKNKTKQNLKEEQLIKDLWILRYTLLHSWFFNIKPPEDQNELTANISLINRAFQDVKGTSDYLPWLTKGFVEYAGTNQLKFSDLKEFESHVAEKVSKKIPLIAFECTERRLGGELHDFVIELIMTMVVQDKKVFELSDDISLKKEEVENIKNVIDKMKPTKKDLEDFIDSLGGDKD